MNKRIKRIVGVDVILLLSLILLTACGGGGGYGSSSPPPTSSTVLSTACTVTPSAIVSALSTTSFVSSAVTISVNQVVQWNNISGFAHTVTSTTVPANGTFNAALANNTSICLKFTAPGTFNYQCTFHPSMIGSVTVN